ncbi:MAG: CBS domain-containing protein, partial [Candidatus Binatia bacterium]
PRSMKKYKKMPSVGSVMTPFPFFADAADPVAKVERLMRRHKIRHVPVQRNGEVVGIVSERDLQHWSSHSPAADKSLVLAAAVMVPDPYVVAFDTPLSEVAAEMNRRRIGSALVARQGKLAGILSVMDICRILASLLDAEFPVKNGNDAA